VTPNVFNNEAESLMTDISSIGPKELSIRSHISHENTVPWAWLYLEVCVVEATWAAGVVGFKDQQVIEPRSLFTVTRPSHQMVVIVAELFHTREEEEHSGTSEDSGRYFFDTHTLTHTFTQFRVKVVHLISSCPSSTHIPTYYSTLDLQIMRLL